MLGALVFLWPGTRTIVPALCGDIGVDHEWCHLISRNFCCPPPLISAIFSVSCSLWDATEHMCSALARSSDVRVYEDLESLQLMHTSSLDGILSMTVPICPRYFIPDANSWNDKYIPPESLWFIHNPNTNPNFVSRYSHYWFLRFVKPDGARLSYHFIIISNNNNLSRLG